MHISESNLDDSVHLLADFLKRLGIELNEENMTTFNNELSSVLNDSFGIVTQQNVEFKDLLGDQWMAWMNLARDVQTGRGDDPEQISSEEAEREAGHLFALHGGILPQ